MSTTGDGRLDACTTHYEFHKELPGDTPAAELGENYHQADNDEKHDMDGSVLFFEGRSQTRDVHGCPSSASSNLVTADSVMEKWSLLTDADVLFEAEGAKSTTKAMMEGVPQVNYWRQLNYRLYVSSVLDTTRQHTTDSR